MVRDRGIVLHDRQLLDSLMSRGGYTNRSLARKVGCSHQMIGLLRSGKQTTCMPCLARPIAEALGVLVEVLFDTSHGVEHDHDDQDCAASEVNR